MVPLVHPCITILRFLTYIAVVVRVGKRQTAWQIVDTATK
jgi:hypothetical protein